MSKKTGLDCKLYIDDTPLADGPVGGNWSEVTLAREVSVNMEAGEADITARDNAGWKATRAGVKDGTFEVEAIWDPTDTELESLRAAFFAGSEIAMAAMDGDIAVAGSEGFVSNCYVTNFNRGEPLEEGVALSITLKPSGKQQWYEVAS